ncbi:MAG: putative glycoside hydrolase [Chloroflexia bacterium]|nr:putative glycoside hydrolase [Chloroflexia bacterium]
MTATIARGDLISVFASADTSRQLTRRAALRVALIVFATAAVITLAMTAAPRAVAAEPVRIEGIVHNADGVPIHGARVAQGDSADVTGKDGIFTLRGGDLDLTERVHVFASGHTERWVEVDEQGEPLEVTLELRPIKAIYLNPLISTSDADIDRLIALIDDTELNAIVIDIKEELVFYDTEIELFRDAGTVQPILDLSALMDKLEAHDIYSIARLVVFKDSIVAERFPDLAVRNSATGGLWRDMNGVAWVNPTDERVWEANSDLAVEAHRHGFDEIQYDYVRFPTDGDLSTLDYGVANTQANREAAITGFLAMSSEKLWPLGAKISSDVFGYTLLVDDDLGIGQNFVELAAYVDYLSPMVYPSHFPNGSLDVAGHPNAFPYETIEISMSLAKEKLPTRMLKVRPWLQDFTFFDLPPAYGNDEVRAQIDAAEAVGTSGWMLWDPNNEFHAGALDPDTKRSSSPPGEELARIMNRVAPSAVVATRRARPRRSATRSQTAD